MTHSCTYIYIYAFLTPHAWHIYITICVGADVCSSGPCGAHGKCIGVEQAAAHNATGPSGGAAYRCACESGFSGTQCQHNIDECESEPCQNDGQCIDEANGYRCECLAGFSGVRCESQMNGCWSQPCEHASRCEPLTNSTAFICHCTAGFTGQFCQEGMCAFARRLVLTEISRLDDT